MCAQKLIYKGLKRHNRFFFFMGIAINRIFRGLKGDKAQDVYQVHGSFIIFGKEALGKLGTVFDENMFLFAEESYLALKAEQLKVRICYNPHVCVLHKEDGSMQFLSDVNDKLRDANIYVFEKYYKFK